MNSLGHSPRIVRDALNRQSAQIINVSPAYYNEPMCRLAQLPALNVTRAEIDEMISILREAIQSVI